MRHSINRIRKSDEKTRFRWLVGLSTAATVIVVIAWALYMRAFVFTSPVPNTQEDVRFGFWPVFKNGLTITGSSISKGLDGIFSNIPTIGRNTTTIQNPE